MKRSPLRLFLIYLLCFALALVLAYIILSRIAEGLRDGHFVLLLFAALGGDGRVSRAVSAAQPYSAGHQFPDLRWGACVRAGHACGACHPCQPAEPKRRIGYLAGGRVRPRLVDDLAICGKKTAIIHDRIWPQSRMGECGRCPAWGAPAR